MQKDDDASRILGLLGQRGGVALQQDADQQREDAARLAGPDKGRQLAKGGGGHLGGGGQSVRDRDGASTEDGGAANGNGAQSAAADRGERRGCRRIFGVVERRSTWSPPRLPKQQ